VYRFRDAAGEVLYIGRAVNLRRRVTSYWGDLGDRAHLVAMVSRIGQVEAACCASEHEAAWLERNLLRHAAPRWNRAAAGGQEVEVYLRLDDTPGRPGLSVVHDEPPPARRDGVRWFGPYLGGSRVRLAAAGLHRVFPLGYARAGATGTLGDLARERGVTGADRGPLAGAVAAVLGRQPAAVARARALLTARRDAAAQAQAYEVAGRIQAELAALDWVTCRQRAATLERLDADIAGWSDGVLVRFEMRDGRMSRWRQRAATRDEARPWLAGTPACWREFADGNAALAAVLAS
jgi:excinuclease ABC subunit C